jgi:hypothetical protein
VGTPGILPGVRKLQSADETPARRTGKMPALQRIVRSPFIKLRSLSRVLFQYLTRRKLLFALRESLHFLVVLFQPKVFRETQWPPAERRKTGSHNQSEVRVLGRIDYLLFHTTRGFVDHQKDKTVGQLVFAET